MPDYSKGKIYSIRSHQTDDIYIGSTTQSLYERLRGHTRDFNCWKNGEHHYVSSYEILKYDDAYIELIEEHPCQNKDQLRKKEGETIRANDCVNKVIPGRTQKEYREENKEELNKISKKYYEEHKEEMLKKNKEYREDNKEEIRKQRKKYREDNKEEIRKRKKNYFEENKEVILEKQRNHYEENKEVILKKNKKYRDEHKEEIIEQQKKYREENEERRKRIHKCPCGGTYQITTKARHKKLKKHIKYLNNPDSKYCRPCI